MIAKVTLIHYLGLGMQISGTIGAGHDAIFAADAPLSIYQNNSIRGLKSSVHRAHRDTWRVSALVTQLGDVKTFECRSLIWFGIKV
jgi:hypothetical protein